MTYLLRVSREDLWSIVTQEYPAQILGLPPQVNILRLQLDSIHALPPSALDYSSAEQDVGALTWAAFKSEESYIMASNCTIRIEEEKNLKISSFSVC